MTKVIGEPVVQGDLDWEVDQEILHVCRGWREALQKRLETLSACHLLQHCYGREVSQAQFVDVRK